MTWQNFTVVRDIRPHHPGHHRHIHICRPKRSAPQGTITSREAGSDGRTVAIAGDYLSAASFLGITGLVAFSGYDGFIYAIGFLAGWIVALFLVAEPLRAIGKYTFADALTSKFKSKKIRLVAAISTLVVSVFYLIPQMVGSGAIVGPLIGLDYEIGVVISAGIPSSPRPAWSRRPGCSYQRGFLLLIAAIALIGVLVVAGMGLSVPGQFLSGACHPNRGVAQVRVTCSCPRHDAPTRWTSSRWPVSSSERRAAAHPDTVLHRAQAIGCQEVDRDRHRGHGVFYL